MELTKTHFEVIAQNKRTGNSPTDNAFRYGYAQALEDALAVVNYWIENSFVDDRYIGGYKRAERDLEIYLNEKL